MASVAGTMAFCADTYYQKGFLWILGLFSPFLERICRHVAGIGTIFLLVTGDAYIDHPSFGDCRHWPSSGSGRISHRGTGTARLAQCRSILCDGETPTWGLNWLPAIWIRWWHTIPRQKSVAVKIFIPPEKKIGLRPDRATIVYSNRAREAFGWDTPIIIGGMEASLRRFAHYELLGR